MMRNELSRPVAFRTSAPYAAAIIIIRMMFAVLSSCPSSCLAMVLLFTPPPPPLQLSLPHAQQPGTPIIQQYNRNPRQEEQQLQRSNIAYTSYLSSSSSSSLLSSALPEVEVQTQAEQMRQAMVLSTMRGTQWRVFEERGPKMQRLESEGSSGTFSPTNNKKDNMSGARPQLCTSTAYFSGFVESPNKGTVQVESKCAVAEDGTFTAPPTTPADATSKTGRWVTKPSDIRRGSIQITARWKLRLPEGQFIYKGYVVASDRTIGRNGAIAAEMTGVILTGEDVNKEIEVGKFRADLLRQGLGENEKIGQSGDGPIILTAK